MRDPSTTHGRAITSFYVARRQCVNTVCGMSRSKRFDTLIGKETGPVNVEVGGTPTYHRAVEGL
jgi:hypothetical protein